MAVKTIISAADMKQQVDSLRASLCVPETEDSWEIISKSIESLSLICQHGACDLHTDLIPLIRSLSRPLTSAMISERTRLSGVAIDFVSVVASGLGVTFEPLLPIFFPVLLTLCGRTNKVIITRARACINTIIETTQLPSILSYFLQSIKDKSISLRLTAAEGTLTCMNCFNPPDLEKDVRARDIEAILRATARDAHPDIRKVSRKVFQAYTLLLPSRVDSFTAPLSPTMKKYLDVKPSATRSQPVIPSLNPAPGTKNTLSASTSTIAPPRIPTEPVRSQKHIRSVSATVASATSQPNRATTKANQYIPPKTSGSAAMPPPQYIPVRPAQPSSSRVVSASRSTSAVDLRTRAISTISAATIQGGSSSTKTVDTNISSGYPVRPASSSSLRDAPRRPQHPPTSHPGVQTLGASGPRRIPLPEPIAKDDSTARKSTKTSGSNARVEIMRPPPTLKVTKPQASTSTTQAEKTRAIPKVVSSGPGGSSGSTGNARGDHDKPLKVRSITQPTLSQISRTKAVMEGKALAAPKSVRGRPAPSVTAAKSTSSRSKAAVPVPRPPSRSNTTTPAQIPLPPSPSSIPIPLIHENGSAIPLDTPSPPPAPLLASMDLPEEIIEEHTEVCTDGTEKNGHCVEVGSAPLEGDENLSDQHEPTLVPGENDDMDCEAIHSRKPSGHSSDEGTHPGVTTEGPSTPQALLLSQDMVDLSTAKTPISALLSSIQRGFLFTPSSPLSPPQSYLSRVPASEGMKDLAIPFPLHVEGTEQAVPCSKRPFMFGVVGGETGRSALGNVENLDIHK